jgi:hypothetical protein
VDWPTSIREINDLPERDKIAIYRTLLPEWLYINYGLDPDTLTVEGQPVVQFRFPRGSRAFELSVKRCASDPDPMLYLNLADTFNQQLLVLLVVVNDMDSPRFDIDVDENGNSTHLGTTSRNIPAEAAAMNAGLAPGQIRRGLRAFRQTVPLFEEFVRHMGHEIFFIEPLAYHNAITFERYGFSYTRGHQEMIRLNRDFQPGGELFNLLDSSSPFRQPDAWKTVRGRSWAIHDGILGHPFTGFQMYKRIGIHAGIDTFTNAEW